MAKKKGDFMVKIFDKDYLVNELDLPWTAEEDHIVDGGRWSSHHRIIFKDKDGKYYSTGYSIGATECQDERPWEYETQVKCIEVEKRQMLVEQWVPVD